MSSQMSRYYPPSRVQVGPAGSLLLPSRRGEHPSLFPPEEVSQKRVLRSRFRVRLALSADAQ